MVVTFFLFFCVKYDQNHHQGPIDYHHFDWSHVAMPSFASFLKRHVLPSKVVASKMLLLLWFAPASLATTLQRIDLPESEYPGTFQSGQTEHF